MLIKLETVDCYVCGGLGTVLDMEDEYSNQYELMHCECCNGSGKVSETFDFENEPCLKNKARNDIMRDITR